jgi:hypothetical protein
MFGLAPARADDYPPNTLPRQSVAKIAEAGTWTFDTIDEATYTATLAADQNSVMLDLSGWTGKSVLDTLGDTAVLSFKRYTIETSTTQSLSQTWYWNGTTDLEPSPGPTT